MFSFNHLLRYKLQFELAFGLTILFSKKFYFDFPCVNALPEATKLNWFENIEATPTFKP